MWEARENGIERVGSEVSLMCFLHCDLFSIVSMLEWISCRVSSLDGLVSIQYLLTDHDLIVSKLMLVNICVTITNHFKSLNYLTNT